jgi:hypothetical protein
MGLCSHKSLVNIHVMRHVYNKVSLIYPQPAYILPIIPLCTMSQKKLSAQQFKLSHKLFRVGPLKKPTKHFMWYWASGIVPRGHSSISPYWPEWDELLFLQGSTDGELWKGVTTWAVTTQASRECRISAMTPHMAWEWVMACSGPETLCSLPAYLCMMCTNCGEHIAISKLVQFGTWQRLGLKFGISSGADQRHRSGCGIPSFLT